ncbi:hypothetical protein D3C85_1099860 [compost metagenome]
MGDFDIRKRLIILEKHVIPRMMLLNQITLENECLHIRGGNDIFKVANFADELLRFSAVTPCEIGAHTVFQNFCLAYIDNGALMVFHNITTRLIRE